LIDIGLCLLSRDMENSVWTVLRTLEVRGFILVNQLDTNIYVHTTGEKSRNSLYSRYGFYSLVSKKPIYVHGELHSNVEKLRSISFLVFSEMR
jgi:hypothetical protein